MGLPLGPTGYNPNAAANTSQVILNTAFALNGLLNVATDVTVTPGYVVSKLNTTMNDTTFGLPTAPSVKAGNIWVVTEGIYPDTLNVDSVQGLNQGSQPIFGDNMNINVIPMPWNGVIAQMQVSFTIGDVVSVNAPLYVKADGTLTPDVGSAISPYEVGYILQSSLTTIAATGVYQCQVVFQPSYLDASSGTYLAAANNLSDVASAATSRTNLGLGTAAVLAAAAVAQTANNLSDLASVATARTNLGLGTAAVKAASAGAQATVASVSGATVSGNLLSAADIAGTVQDTGKAATLVPYATGLSTTFGGGGTSFSIPVTGMVVGDKVQLTLNAATTIVPFKAIAATGQINVTYAADPGAGTVHTYTVWH